MEWLNYHHLLYFWLVAREGTLVAAGKVLGVSHPTLSAQIRALEERLEQKLFSKVGRKLVLTDAGRVVFRYADEIFRLGNELTQNAKKLSTESLLRLEVGIADAVPKLVVRRLLQPALRLPFAVHLICHERSHEKLLADLALHSLDVVIADSPVPTGSSIRAYSHLLGESGVSFFGTTALVKKYKSGFPSSLNGAPLLMPLENMSLRRSLSYWFDRNGIKPSVVAEFEDTALMKVFGSSGTGIFAAPTVVERDVMSQYSVQLLGRVPDVRERFYAISVDRRLKHPAVVAISEAARDDFFDQPVPRR